MAVNSVPRTNYRYLMYPTANNPRLMQTVDWTIGTELTPDIYHDTGSVYPVAANRREQHQTMEGVGPLTISDMILALSSFVPYQISSGDNWNFLVHNGRIETGYTAPSDFVEMYLHSTLDDTEAPSYLLRTPALNELEMDIRREGEARMTQRWISTGLEAIDKRPAADYQPPYREINVIENIDWRISVRRADRGVFEDEVEPVNILRFMIRFPELRQMVYSLNDNSIGYSSTVVKQTQPQIDLHVTATTQWKTYLERYGHFYIDLKTRDNNFSLKMQAQQTELAAFEVEDDIWMATVMLTPFAAYSPVSATASTQGFEAGRYPTSGTATHFGYRSTTNPMGTIGTSGGFVPPSLADIYYDISGTRVYVGVGSNVEWPYLWPLRSIDIATSGATTTNVPMEFEKEDTTANTPDRWRSASTITTAPFTSGTSYTITFNWEWTPDRFMDITMTDTNITAL